MECPKCHSEISDNETVCPACHKVLLLECPNCHTLCDTSVCAKCGYQILVKCSKCSKIGPAINDLCSKCGFPTKTSLAYQECESDEFASVVIKFNNLKNIRRLLKSKPLYDKFFYKLKNLLLAYVKNVDGKFITYGNVFVLNFNKELSFPTSANKAVRLSLRLANAFAELNSKVNEELRTNLGLSISILKKDAEELQELKMFDNNVKLLNVKKISQKYLKGMQVILDQYVWDEIRKDYKTDSLYSLEENGKSIMFYEVVLDSYVLPPENSNEENIPPSVLKEIKKEEEALEEKTDMYSFKVFDINAKCSFITSTAVSIKDRLETIDFNNDCKILSIRSKVEYSADIVDIIKFFEDRDYRVLTVSCTEQLNYKPWGVMEAIFRSYFKLSYYNKFNDLSKQNPNTVKIFQQLFDLCGGKITNALTPEDARYTYMELWGKFLSLLKNVVIIFDGFQNLDDTSIQTLELYFDNFKNIKPNFVFITNDEAVVHSRIKGLLRTPCYTEVKLLNSSFAASLAKIKSDAADFIGSFYFTKIQENFKGSYLYFKYAIDYLKESGVLIDFEDKLLVKDSKSVVIPKDLKSLYKARMKNIGKNQEDSFIIAYLSLIYQELDFEVLKALGIDKIAENAESLRKAGIVRVINDRVFINNYSVFSDVIEKSLKDSAAEQLSKNILKNLGQYLDDTTTALIFDKLKVYKEEYLTLCNNAETAMSSGDYDAYLKNCLGFLSLIENIDSNISQDDINDRKNEVYNSILMCLYSYAPAKIYYIENILLMDAISENDDEKIVKLSNLMLQGALISSNYTDALGLLHNILSRMKNPTMLVDGAINTRFLLLSLVNVEILYNIGNYRECVEVAEDILSVLRLDIIEKIKPGGFSISSFVQHIMDTLTLAAYAKLYLLDSDLEEFFARVYKSMGVELTEKDCILAIKDFLACRIYSTGNIEEHTAFSKVIFLILQEFSNLQTDYKKFAQNIYQAKLLAEELNIKEITLFCDLLIAYAYFKIGITEKASVIYQDVLKQAEESAMFNILLISKYFISKMLVENDVERALININDSLSLIRKYDNQAKILYALFEKFYIEIAQQEELSSVDMDSEQLKLAAFKDDLKRIID